MEASMKTFWVVPIRFWENKEPNLLQVEDASESSSRSLYGFMSLYGHNVYIERADAFPSRDEAVAEAEKRTTAREAEFSAQADRLIEAELRRQQAAKEAV
jgi:hypothetical protein